MAQPCVDVASVHFIPSHVSIKQGCQEVKAPVGYIPETRHAVRDCQAVTAISWDESLRYCFHATAFRNLNLDTNTKKVMVAGRWRASKRAPTKVASVPHCAIMQELPARVWKVMGISNTVAVRIVRMSHILISALCAIVNCSPLTELMAQPLGIGLRPVSCFHSPPTSESRNFGRGAAFGFPRLESFDYTLSPQDPTAHYYISIKIRQPTCKSRRPSPVQFRQIHTSGSNDPCLAVGLGDLGRRGQRALPRRPRHRD